MHYEIVLFQINVLPSYVSDSLDVFTYKSNGILSRQVHHKYTNILKKLPQSFFGEDIN